MTNNITEIKTSSLEKANIKKREKHLNKTIAYKGNIITIKTWLETMKKDGYAPEERQGIDTVRKAKDQKILNYAKNNYILGLSNPNIPDVANGLAAKKRLEEDNYKKPYYRASIASEESSYHLTKIEYNYMLHDTY